VRIEYGHCLQYAIVNGLQYPHSPLVWEVEEMTDHEILRYLRDHMDGLSPSAKFKLTTANLAHSAEIPGVQIIRHNECYVCHVPSPCPTLIERGRR
jgi:hypothetical protein